MPAIAQVLGDELLRDTVIVGGLVPTLLYSDLTPAPETGAHVGTFDVDLALDLVILNEERYEDIVERLERARFVPDANAAGNTTRQRWRSPTGVSIDFLMPPVPPDKRGGRLQGLTSDFAAQTMRGLDLAFKHPLAITLRGVDLDGRNVTRTLPVCAPDIFVMLKALAIANRDRRKDAYDLYYVLKHDVQGPQALGRDLAGFGAHAAVPDAVAVLEREFRTLDGRGPTDVCRFMDQVGNDDLAADVLAFSRDFLGGYGEMNEATRLS